MFSPTLDIRRYGLEGYSPLLTGFAQVLLRLCLACERSDLIRIDANDEVVDAIDLPLEESVGFRNRIVPGDEILRRRRVQIIGMPPLRTNIPAINMDRDRGAGGTVNDLMDIA